MEEKEKTRKQGVIDGINRIGYLSIVIIFLIAFCYLQGKRVWNNIWHKLNQIHTSVEDYCGKK